MCNSCYCYWRQVDRVSRYFIYLFLFGVTDVERFTILLWILSIIATRSLCWKLTQYETGCENAIFVILRTNDNNNICWKKNKEVESIPFHCLSYKMCQKKQQSNSYTVSIFDFHYIGVRVNERICCAICKYCHYC